MRILFHDQLPKDPSYPDANEDAIRVAEVPRRVAVCDGASESFDSRTWATLLAETFVRDPALRPDWLAQLVDEYKAEFDIANLTWSKQAAFERGSFATLLGVEVSAEAIEVTSVGDSLAVLLVDDDLVGSFPYVRFEEFHRRPELFSTNPAHNAFFSSPDFFSRHHKTWPLSRGKDYVLLCMTDALGEWSLRNASEGAPPWAALRSIRDIADLEAIVFRERGCRRMRIDDVSLVSIALEGTGSV